MFKKEISIMKFMLYMFILLVTPYHISYATEKTELPPSYEAKAIYFQVGWSGGEYIINKEGKNSGFFHGELKEIITNPPEAVELVSGGTSKMKVGFATSMGTILVGLATVGVTGGISLIPGVIGYFWGLTHMLEGTNDLQKGIWVYNGYVVNN